MLTIYLAPFVALLGALTYGYASNAKAQEIGRIAFAFGLLVSLLVFGRGTTIHLP